MALRRSLNPVVVLAAVAAVACSHGEQFSAPAAGADPNPPRPVLGLQRLTFGDPGDWAPAWVGADDVIGFSWEDPAHADHDRCVAIMPLAYRRITSRICHGGRDAGDSANAVFTQAFSPSGAQVAYVEAEGPIVGMATSRQMAVRSVGGRDAVTVVSFPKVMNNGVLHQGAVDLAWTSESTLVYVGTRIVYVTGVPEAIDTTETGIEAVRLTVDQSGGRAVVIPNTDSILTLAVDPVTGTGYALFQNHPDTVFTLDLLTGQRTFALDLAALHPVRYLDVRGGRLAAIVGGASTHRSGNIAVIDLPGGAPVLLPPVVTGVLAGYYFGRPALSPGRGAIVAEGFSYAIVPGAALDTIVNHASDLYLVAVP